MIASVLRALPTIGRHAVRLVARMITTMIAATFLLFVVIEISIKGGFRAVVLPPGANPANPRVRELIDAYHLDDNLFLRYGHWAADALRGDFGRSIRGSESVTEALTHRLPISLELMLIAIVLIVLIGIPLGLLAAAVAERWSGQMLGGLMSFLQALPVYLSPIFLVWIFVLKLGWLPASGWVRISDSFTDNLKGAALPVVALVLAEVGIIARIVRSDVLRVLELDYIAAATGKGLSRSYVLFRHALRPASLGLLNQIALNIGSFLGGAMIVEMIFGIGGLGQVLLRASFNRDLYLLLGLTTYLVTVYVFLNALADATMLMLDPRIRRPAAG